MTSGIPLIVRQLALITAGTALAVNAAAAPITIVAPFTPGGAADTVARSVGHAMGQILDQTVVIENRSGGSGIVGAGVVVRAAPDGHTLLLTTDGIFANPALDNPEAQAVLAQLVPVANLAEAPLVLASSNASAIVSIDTLLQQARQRQHPLTYGTPGVGSAHHLAGIEFARHAGLAMTDIPYRGTSAGAAGLASGEIDLLFGVLTSIQPLVASGRARILAVTSAGRFALAPEVVALGERYPGYNMVASFGLMAPAGTPDEVRERLAAAVAQALQRADVQEQLQGAGLVAAFQGPQVYAKALAELTAERKAIIRQAGIRVD